MSVCSISVVSQCFQTNTIFIVFEELFIIFSYMWSMFCEFSFYAKGEFRSQILKQLLWPTVHNNRHNSENVDNGQRNFSSIFIKENRNTNKITSVFIYCNDAVYTDKSGRGRWKSPHKLTEVEIIITNLAVRSNWEVQLAIMTFMMIIMMITMAMMTILVFLLLTLKIYRTIILPVVLYGCETR